MYDLPDDDDDGDFLLPELPPMSTANVPMEMLRAQTSTQHLWPVALVRDLALGIDDEDIILARYGIERSFYEKIATTPRFLKEFSDVLTTLQRDGQIFRTRATVQAEDYLGILDDIITDASTSTKDRIQAIIKVVEWSGCAAPRASTNTEAATGNATAVQININL